MEYQLNKYVTQYTITLPSQLYDSEPSCASCFFLNYCIYSWELEVKMMKVALIVMGVAAVRFILNIYYILHL
jgi:hypothetical protein